MELLIDGGIDLHIPIWCGGGTILTWLMSGGLIRLLSCWRWLWMLDIIVDSGPSKGALSLCGLDTLRSDSELILPLDSIRGGLLLYLISYVAICAGIACLHPSSPSLRAGNGGHESGSALFRMIWRLAGAPFSDVITSGAVLCVPVLVNV